MSISPQEGFQLLKREVKIEVEKTLRIRKEIKDWSMQDLQDFQADLEAKCKSTVSEKWIYLHFKNDNEKLPRVDVLNLISNYCNYKNWEDFLFLKTVKAPKRNYKWIIYLTAVIITLGFGFQLLTNFDTSKILVLVFKDAYTQEIISTDQIQLEWLSTIENHIQKESHHVKLSMSLKDSIEIKGPYYKPYFLKVNPEQLNDTIYIKLYPDDYALMLNYFSRSDVVNIEKRQRQLENAIHEEAKVFQVYQEYEGLEILNKEEFIERLLLPINNLKNLVILDIQYQDDLIYRLRFMQKTNSK